MYSSHLSLIECSLCVDHTGERRKDEQMFISYRVQRILTETADNSRAWGSHQESGSDGENEEAHEEDRCWYKGGRRVRPKETKR